MGADWELMFHAGRSSAGALPVRFRVRLNRPYDKLRQQFMATLTDLQNAKRQIDEMTHPGGAQVTAYCATDTESRNTAGASEDCSTSGYQCERVSGLCRRSCQTSDMCSPGFLCDTSIERCAPQPT